MAPYIVTWPVDLPAWILACLGHPSPDQCVSAALAARLPNVRVHCGVRANTAQLASLFGAADLFCLPTRADGSSIATLEAMATGLPVLVSAVGGIPELIEDERTGLLLRPGDAGDLADKMGALLDVAILAAGPHRGSGKRDRTMRPVPGGTSAPVGSCIPVPGGWCPFTRPGAGG
jgi:glycosyltransferase involved in cell wall biosynthesis